MSRRVGPEDLDPHTREALLGLAAPQPRVGEPERRLFPDVLAGRTGPLLDQVIAREHEFVANEPYGHPQRHGLALADPPPAAEPVLDLVRARLDDLAVDLGVVPAPGPDNQEQPHRPERPMFELSDVVVTAHGDGDFLGPHHDDGWGSLRNGRLLSFVYWFHRLPRRFEGGTLTLSGWTRVDGALSPTGPKVHLEPVDDCLVVFPSGTRHEVHAVHCDPDDFGTARFALVGFIRRATT